MKKLLTSLIAIAMLTLAYRSPAPTLAGWHPGLLSDPTITNIFSNGVRVSSMTIINPNTNVITFAFIDSSSLLTNLPLQTLQFSSNGGYSILQSYTTNIQKWMTNWAGTIGTVNGMATNYWESNAVYTFTNTFPASSNYYPVVFAGTIAANSVFILTNSFQTMYGLTWTNGFTSTQNVSINITYSPNF